MTLRKVLFWVHFGAGAVAGLVILIMSFTGVVLVFERQIAAWVDRGYRSQPPQLGASRLAIGNFGERVCANPSPPLSGIRVQADPRMPVEVSYGRDRIVYFDSYTGREMGVGSERTRHFFTTVESWHRWFGVPDEHRSVGRMVTGVCNLAFLVLVGTGVFLWWPRDWSWQRLRAAITFRWPLSAGRARDWNWHTVTGFWCAIPLLVIVMCGVVMSFPWANNLLYRLTGNTPPAQMFVAVSSRASATAPSRPHGEPLSPRGSRRPGSGAAHKSSEHPRGSPETAAGSVCATWDVDRVNGLWERAQNQVPGWQTITFRVPSNAAGRGVFLIDRGSGGRPDQRSQLTIDWQTGETVRWEPFSAYNLGRRLRAWVRFSHTGEAAGVAGQIVAALAAAGAVVLVFTGLAMAWRRAWSVVAFRPAPSASKVSNQWVEDGE